MRCNLLLGILCEQTFDCSASSIASLLLCSVRLDLHSGQNVELLGTQRVRPLTLGCLLGKLEQELGSVKKVVSFAVELMTKE